ncbi:Potassium channel tetramerisation-type BTB domain and BTB/POZ fold domain-containing protein [Strongyloides ratti]|uniref:Potassium channel tetramerisation-type BTB domain and BTB/POZ fold domain-containing protein n=1 Tax=Strongyloides ratti TaxID=34506 RepID=A0A090L5P4_STRRB|nr:Potassium channel tetramerisation-type BTB domain and BTB/POZ fold domain-containing protein [Strongyloides ratti]CEF63437.1 Potassium channel tetramerisation-type BTB domain and BTB/POZ fold domain-containing protein [Strongyloides ratti]
MDQIIRLNVGGQRIDTYLRTLLIDKSFIYYDVFKNLLDKNCSLDLPIDTDGNYFIDEDPEEFGKKLKELRESVQRENGNTFKSKKSLPIGEEKPLTNKKSNGFLFWKS